MTKKTSKDKRKAIALGLQQCIVEKGWAYTKLNDIAAKAGLVPSHVRYYFRSKEDLLAYRFDELCDEFGFRVYQIDRSSPLVWFQQLGYLVFTENAHLKETLLVLLEMNVAVAHSEQMMKTKTAADLTILQEIENQFSQAPLVGNLDPRSAAQLVFATMNGLLTNEVFDSGPTVTEARSLFFSFVESISGLPLSTAPVSELVDQKMLKHEQS